MGPLTALALATPIFGFSLMPPTLEALPSAAAPMAQLEFTLEEVEEHEKATEAQEPGDEMGHAAPAKPSARPQRAARVAEEDEQEATTPRLPEPKLDKEVYVAQLRKRARLAKTHRTLGITTWALTGLAVIAGTIQWRNLYAGDAGSNPCVTGDAWLGQQQCYGTPWFHALTGFAAGAAYFSTLGLAMAMPDPDNASRGDSQYAKTLRTHKILRWVHLSGMVAQMVLGIVIANPRLSGGLDRANDYGTLRALSLVHLTAGYVTLGALSWAGTIMLI